MTTIENFIPENTGTVKLRKMLKKCYGMWDNGIARTYSREGLLKTYSRGLTGSHRFKFIENLEVYFSENEI